MKKNMRRVGLFSCRNEHSRLTMFTHLRCADAGPGGLISFSSDHLTSSLLLFIFFIMRPFDMYALLFYALAFYACYDKPKFMEYLLSFLLKLTNVKDQRNWNESFAKTYKNNLYFTLTMTWSLIKIGEINLITLNVSFFANILKWVNQV